MERSSSFTLFPSIVTNRSPALILSFKAQFGWTAVISAPSSSSNSSENPSFPGEAARIKSASSLQGTSIFLIHVKFNDSQYRTTYFYHNPGVILCAH
mmetsp:Transcript_31728/g.60583  ORF Transcript_31728/g.60583 Transcript_31728/m.60583 type:complete len:97 (-) Transcript_31728:104-394(-)